MSTYEQLPFKLQSLKGAAILSTEFLGATEEVRGPILIVALLAAVALWHPFGGTVLPAVVVPS